MRSPGGELDRIVFRDAADDDPPEQLQDVFSHLGGGKARQHARLGTLLQERDHDDAAVMQYEKARAADPRARRDPVLSRRLGRLYVGLGDFAPAVDLLAIAAADDPDDANLAADQGRALLETGDADAAHDALWRALRVNPFIPSLHCDLAQLTTDATRRLDEEALCRR
jgi:tetratricopeptide (TPR) repeat protein